MVFRFTKVVRDGHTKWFTILVTPSIPRGAEETAMSLDLDFRMQDLATPSGANGRQTIWRRRRASFGIALVG